MKKSEIYEPTEVIKCLSKGLFKQAVVFLTYSYNSNEYYEILNTITIQDMEKIEKELSGISYWVKENNLKKE